MKRMGARGFTIVESMIVLAVTGVLFISLASLVTGQQNTARFKAAVIDITSQIQSTINEVSTGYYPSTNDVRCIATGDIITLTEVTTSLGTNSGCLYLGRAMMFGTNLNLDPDRYRIHTIVGLRRTATGAEPATIREAAPRVIAPGSATNLYNPSNTPEKSDVLTSLYGTRVVSMRSLNGGGAGIPEDIVGFAIVSSPSQQITFDLNGSVESGTVIPSIIPIPANGSTTYPGVTHRKGVDLLVSAIGMATPQIPAEPTDGPIELCFRSGTTDQSALVTIGAASSTTSVDYKILNSVDCS